MGGGFMVGDVGEPGRYGMRCKYRQAANLCVLCLAETGGTRVPTSSAFAVLHSPCSLFMELAQAVEAVGREGCRKTKSRATPPVSHKPMNIPRGAWEDERYQNDMEWSRSFSTGVLFLFNANNRCSSFSPRSISGHTEEHLRAHRRAWQSWTHGRSRIACSAWSGIHVLFLLVSPPHLSLSLVILLTRSPTRSLSHPSTHSLTYVLTHTTSPSTSLSLTLHSKQH
ncbi:hypothetical protein B0T18DRAFT_226579 [Schizothecium vesticola]|uniref:Uncharacterized protein n=1 Tax=Schizothecium vesticola TaxID=314040 RepID=A0AA40EKV7_9PEZI|nr:hypothetical protein B0T18DRAFT_226579 [Schizothecium vesticola]